MRFAVAASAAIVFFCAALVVTSAAVDQDASFLKDDDDNTTTTTTEATTTTTTTEATTTTTTTEATTTTTTTEATTTTTEATTTTTTTEATTTTTEPTTTTPAPEPTPEPTPAPAPTPTPAPKPTPTPGTWTVFDADTNTTCVVAKMAASFLVPYLSLDGAKKNATVVLPSDATATGSCAFNDKGDQSIVLSWKPEAATNANNFTIIFSRNETSEHFMVSELKLVVFPDAGAFPNASSAKRISASLTTDLFGTSVNKSYQCHAQEKAYLNVDGAEETVELSMKSVQLEAFRTKSDDSFSSAVSCAADAILTGDTVPIAVGCTLAALVVVVLMAYLFGRRKARQRGYQSV